MLSLFAALLIAFPKEGQTLPYVENCYVIGAADRGNSEVLVNGAAVRTHRSGAFATLVEVSPGKNVITVGETNVSITVANKPANSPKAAPRVYEKLEYASDIPQAGPQGKLPKEITIVIDPGHGGEDNGAISPHLLKEKDFNLQIARRVREELIKRGLNVVMTRDEDSFPALYDRPKVAHQVKADAFVSLHHNAPPFDRDPNRLRYHAVYCWNEIGERLATAINAAMARELKDELPSNGVIHGNLAVTRNPEIPSCLVEVDFITHPQGEVDSWNPVRQQRVAAAIAEGIREWITK